MTGLKTAVVMFGLLATSLAPAIRAGSHYKETHLTIAQPLRVHNTVLAPGDYVFRLTAPDANHSIVSIYNGDGTRLQAVVIGFSAYRSDPAEKNLFTFSKSQSDRPESLKSWFYRGDSVGVEFPVEK